MYMAIDTDIVERVGDELYEALISKKARDPLSDQYQDMTIDDAYAIQQRLISRRVESGEKIVGKKSASQAKRS